MSEGMDSDFLEDVSCQFLIHIGHQGLQVQRQGEGGEKLSDLQKKLQELLNTRYEEVSIQTTKKEPYKAIVEGKSTYMPQHWPERLPFKTPGSFGAEQLKILL